MSQGRKHILPPPELELPRTLHDDRHRIEEAQVPIVTISATYKSEIAEHLGEHSRVINEAVLSRAHYSMSMAVFSQADLMGLTSWYVDPMNYVSQEGWKKIAFVERVGKLTARVPLLKTVKGLADTFVRGKLPIQDAIEKPLLYVTERAHFPIVSLHAIAGSVIAKSGKEVVQVVTDPFVRPEYIPEIERKNVVFAVFDQQTKDEFLSVAKKLKMNLPDKRIVITGPPVDPKIVAVRSQKNPIAYKSRELRLVVATGGLGTNKGEIRQLLDNVLPKIESEKISLLLYAGTQNDFKEMFLELCSKYEIEAGDVDSLAKVRIIYNESIMQANRDLVKHAFYWADGFVTKPSGDMAYDAVAAGCFILSLDPWGYWEKKIEENFTARQIATRADADNFMEQIKKLSKSSWIEKAIQNALDIDKIYLEGAKRIVDLQQNLAYNE